MATTRATEKSRSDAVHKNNNARTVYGPHVMIVPNDDDNNMIIIVAFSKYASIVDKKFLFLLHHERL
jgi:hypothetical protein